MPKLVQCISYLLLYQLMIQIGNLAQECHTYKEKDLRLTINDNMKASEQCRIAASKGNQILGMIRRNIAYQEKGLIAPLYKAIVRHHIRILYTGMEPALKPVHTHLSYEEILKECGLTTLETRRFRGDQINFFLRY